VQLLWFLDFKGGSGKATDAIQTAQWLALKDEVRPNL